MAEPFYDLSNSNCTTDMDYISQGSIRRNFDETPYFCKNLVKNWPESKIAYTRIESNFKANNMRQRKIKFFFEKTAESTISQTRSKFPKKYNHDFDL